MIFDVMEGYNDYDEFDDVMESSYEGEVTLALEGARMRYFEELEKKQKAIKAEIERLEKHSSMATGERKREIDDKIVKLMNDYRDIGRRANDYGSAYSLDVSKQKEYAKTVGKKYSEHDSETKAAKNFKKDFGGPERGKYDPPVSRYKQSGSGPQKESFIIDGEEVLYEESLDDDFL